MTLLDFSVSNPVITLAAIAASVMIIYTSYTLFNQNLTGQSTLLGVTALLVVYLFTQAYEGILREARTNTIVVMPNKQNLRLGEDGNLSFCINGMARNWQKTKNGIISTKTRYYLGRPMRCLTVEEGINFLEENGATLEQLNSMRKAYSLD